MALWSTAEQSSHRIIVLAEKYKKSEMVEGGWWVVVAHQLVHDAVEPHAAKSSRERAS